MSAAATIGRDTRIVAGPSDFRLERGASLADVQVAFEISGPDDAPVVAVQGGISAGRHVTRTANDPSPGWWEDLVGPGRAVDTLRFRALSFDYLGGAGATTGPLSWAEEPGSRFPEVTSGDQARILSLVLEELGVARLHAFVGASYGGMVGFRLAALLPERVERLVAISAGGASDPWATGWRALQRRVLALGLARGCGDEALALARGMGMLSYRGRDELASRFGGEPPAGEGAPFPVESYLLARGAEFVRRFSPEALLVLSRSIDLHAVDPGEVRVPVTLVATSSDQLVPPASLRRFAERLGGKVAFACVDSVFGHDAFLKEPGLIGPIVEAALRDSRP